MSSDGEDLDAKAALETRLAAYQPAQALWLSLARAGLGAGMATFALASGWGAIGIAGVAAGLYFFGTGFLGLTKLRAHALSAAMADQLAEGKPEAAKQWASLSLGRSRSALVKKRAAQLEAEAALARGDLGRCLREATSGLDASSGLIGHDESKQIDLALLSLRAFANALVGKGKQARRDVASARKMAGALDLGSGVLAGEGALLRPLARVALAEAVLMVRAGHRGKLEAHLRRHRAAILSRSLPRDRALFRALERFARAGGGSPYRDREPGDVASSREPLSREDWMASMLPELRPFFSRIPSPARARTDGSKAAPASSLAPASRAPAVPLPRRDTTRAAGLPSLALAMGLVGFLMRRSDLGGFFSQNFVTFMGCAVIAAVAAFVMLRRGRASDDRKTIQKAYRAIAAGDESTAKSLFERVNAGSKPEYRARAQLSLARAAARRGDFDDALAYAELGLLLQESVGVSGVALKPDLVIERATALAGVGRTKDALAVIASLPPLFAGGARGRFRVELHVRLANKDFEGAVVLVAARSPLLPIDQRTELLADLVTAIYGEGVSETETARLHTDLGHAEERRFVEAVSPDLLRRFEETSGAIVGSDTALELSLPSGPPACEVVAPLASTGPKAAELDEAACQREAGAEAEAEAEADALNARTSAPPPAAGSER